MYASFESFEELLQPMTVGGFARARRTDDLFSSLISGTDLVRARGLTHNLTIRHSSSKRPCSGS